MAPIAPITTNAIMIQMTAVPMWATAASFRGGRES